MKKAVLLICLILSLYSCSDDKQLTSNVDNETGYSAFLKSNPGQAKSSRIILDNSTINLEYVRDQEYYDGRTFCYGHLVTDASNFADILGRVVSGYNFNTAWKLSF